MIHHRAGAAAPGLFLTTAICRTSADVKGEGWRFGGQAVGGRILPGP